MKKKAPNIIPFSKK